ncbi:MAG: hypothetical protein ACRDZ5_05875 [Acidimicrobiales bacterium]
MRMPRWAALVLCPVRGYGLQGTFAFTLGVWSPWACGARPK